MGVSKLSKILGCGFGYPVTVSGFRKNNGFKRTRPGGPVTGPVNPGMFRYKTTFCQQMRSRSFENQRVEVNLACKILNTMTSLGMPESHRAG